MKSRIQTPKLIKFILIAALMTLFGWNSVFAEQTPWAQARSKTFAKLGKVSKAQGKKRIGVVLVTLSNPFWVAMKDGYQAAAREFGVEIDVQAAPQENSVTAQLNILENMIAKDYDAIVVHTITAQNLLPGIIKAAKKGIPVISDRRIDVDAARNGGGKPIIVDLVDFYGQGKAGAQFIVNRLSGKGGGKVAIIEGLPGAPQSEARRDGAADVFKKSRGINLVSVQPGNWDRAKAYNVTTNLLQAHPDLKAIICANDIMALAATEAIEAMGKTGQVIVVGIDLIPQAKQAIAEGKLAASVAFSPWVIGEACARSALLAIAGSKVPSDISVVSALVSIENVKQMQDWK